MGFDTCEDARAILHKAGVVFGFVDYGKVHADTPEVTRVDTANCVEEFSNALKLPLVRGSKVEDVLAVGE